MGFVPELIKFPLLLFQLVEIWPNDLPFNLYPLVCHPVSPLLQPVAALLLVALTLAVPLVLPRPNRWPRPAPLPLAHRRPGARWATAAATSMFLILRVCRHKHRVSMPRVCNLSRFFVWQGLARIHVRLESFLSHELAEQNTKMLHYLHSMEIAN